eukprot:2967451-Rhodomonas_salina.1
MKRAGNQAQGLKLLETKGVVRVLIPMHWQGRLWLPAMWTVKTNTLTMVRPGGDEFNAAATDHIKGFDGAKVITITAPEIPTKEWAALTMGVMWEWSKPGECKDRHIRKVGAYSVLLCAA